MAKDYRIIDNNGKPVPFTCQNRSFRTDTGKGFPHGKGFPRGSVFEEPLIDNNVYSLWLEHVIASDSQELYWLMWYDNNKGGKPTIPLSGVFSKNHLKSMAEKLINFVPQ